MYHSSLVFQPTHCTSLISHHSLPSIFIGIRPNGRAASDILNRTRGTKGDDSGDDGGGGDEDGVDGGEEEDGEGNDDVNEINIEDDDDNDKTPDSTLTTTTTTTAPPVNPNVKLSRKDKKALKKSKTVRDPEKFKLMKGLAMSKKAEELRLSQQRNNKRKKNIDDDEGDGDSGDDDGEDDDDNELPMSRTPPLLLSHSARATALSLNILSSPPTPHTNADQNPPETYYPLSPSFHYHTLHLSALLNTKFETAVEVRRGDLGVRGLPYVVICRPWDGYAVEKASDFSLTDSKSIKKNEIKASLAGVEEEEKEKEKKNVVEPFEHVTIPTRPLPMNSTNSTKTTTTVTARPSPLSQTFRSLILPNPHHPENTHFHVSCGGKFGTDFLVYNGERELNHAFGGVRVYDLIPSSVGAVCGRLPNPYDLTGYVRGLNTAGKISILAVNCVDEGGKEGVCWIELVLTKVEGNETHLRKLKRKM